MIIRKAFRYRIKPTKEQKEKLVSFAGACRFVYNRGLANRKELYEKAKKSISYYEQNVELTQLKKQEDTSWLKDIHSQILQQSLQDLDKGFKRFFKEKDGGYPRFKC
ncbi:MAG: helix-turn-helix domain-containing protein, partial [Chlamydiia bacterium]|nr:helix-turn-helix domain-containing protein [Chlamydiia bacterium]